MKNTKHTRLRLTLPAIHTVFVTFVTAGSLLALTACDEESDIAPEGRVADIEQEAAAEAPKDRHDGKGRHGKHKGHHEGWKELDVDQDGSISLEEAKGRRFADKFTEIDADGSGSLDKAELHAFKEKMHDPAERANHVMGKFDADQDGFLTADEVAEHRLAEHFDAIDSDADGKLGLEELTEFKKTHRKDGKHGKHHGKHGKHGPSELEAHG